MEYERECESETYRAIVIAPNGEELLLLAANTQFLLPSMEIPHGQRVAETFTAAMKSEWGQDVICLFTHDVGAPADHSGGIHYQVMECCDRGAYRDARTQWISISSLSKDSFVDLSDHRAVEQSLAECNAHARGSESGPFARLGWFRQLHRRVEEAILPLNLELNGSFRQFNASPFFSLIRLETNGPALWFKAVGEPNLREFPVTLMLARLFPKYVPPILAAWPPWNGWLTPEVDGINLAESREMTLWETAAATLAKLQIESVSSTAQILGSGARCLRASTLLELAHPFLSVASELMEQQTKVPPLVLTHCELQKLEEHICGALSFLDHLGIPDAVGHLDLNPGNIIVSPDGCVLLDWAEACIGHPFFSFEYLLEHFRRAVGVDPRLEEQLIASYAAPWGQMVSPEVIAEALTVAPLLAAFSYAAGSCPWADQDRLRAAATAGYLRGMTRRMNREAKQLIERRSPCLS